MAANIGALVDALEAEFGDSANALLSAAEYQAHIQRAISELSLVRPREVKETLTTTDGSRELDVTDLTHEVVRVEAVEYPVDEDPRRFVQWSLWGDTLEMLIEETPGASENVDVYYGAVHTVDASGSSLPAEWDWVVLVGGAGYAAAQLQLEATNKANTAGLQAVRDWQAISGSKLSAFRRALRGLGSGLKVSTLYVPANPEPDQSTVAWEP